VGCPLLRMGRSDFCELMLCEVLLLGLGWEYEVGLGW
jgi:hypothetical protein